MNDTSATGIESMPDTRHQSSIVYGWRYCRCTGVSAADKILKLTVERFVCKRKKDEAVARILAQGSEN